MEEGKISNSFYETNIKKRYKKETKPSNENKNLQTTISVEYRHKKFNKILVNQIQQHNKRIQ